MEIIKKHVIYFAQHLYTLNETINRPKRTLKNML